MEERDDVSHKTPDSAANKKSKSPEGIDNPFSRKSAETAISDEGMIFYAYLVLLFILYGFLSFTLPELLSLLAGNPVGTLGILVFGFILLALLAKFVRTLSRSTFVEIDRKARGEAMPPIKVSRSALSAIIKRINSGATPLGRVINEVSARSDNQQKVDESKLVGRERPLGTAFERYICGTVESLDRHISLTEEKGSNLLDRGLLFLFGGIVFYVIAIAVWQVWAKYGEPKESIMYVGMFACSVVFLVCEFLAAWFLKQYRHYVDASLACLRVKSVYDRYLLSYYAVKEIEPDASGESKKLDRVLEAIKQDVMWPEHKENLSNDFNYMIESMSSIHTSVDKLKQVFESKAKPGKNN